MKNLLKKAIGYGIMIIEETLINKGVAWNDNKESRKEP